MQKSKNTNPDSTRNNDYFEENINSHVTSSTTLLIDFEKELNLKAATLRSQTESLNSLNTQKQILLKQQEILLETARLQNIREQSRKRRLDDTLLRDELASQQRNRVWWGHNDEDRIEAKLDNQNYRKIALLYAESDTNKNLIKAKNEHKIVN